ncbi:MAG: RidA family protein [Sphingomonas bacterium]|uniref:RidA family protein n=1 Tax=Sphingomonas bacterium TaxID=1895847 RepID=UPI00260BCEB3|nr:RidA family protein [Sphingomonas bacterium]MDB5705530.1 RidA family protein [Sphingomonas bacterium]
MAGAHRTLLPPGWPRPKGYANGIAAEGRMIFTGGIIGWDAAETIVAPDLVGQLRQILVNTLAVIGEGGAGPEHIVRMTWYITDRDEYVAHLAAIGALWRELMGRNYPAMAVMQVVSLVERAAKVEIETIAVVP